MIMTLVCAWSCLKRQNETVKSILKRNGAVEVSRLQDFKIQVSTEKRHFIEILK